MRELLEKKTYFILRTGTRDKKNMGAVMVLDKLFDTISAPALGIKQQFSLSSQGSTSDANIQTFLPIW